MGTQGSNPCLSANNYYNLLFLIYIMAYSGTAARLDRAVFPLAGSTMAAARLKRIPSPSVVMLPA